jgi:hypothetical protein
MSHYIPFAPPFFIYSVTFSHTVARFHSPALFGSILVLRSFLDASIQNKNKNSAFKKTAPLFVSTRKEIKASGTHKKRDKIT